MNITQIESNIETLINELDRQTFIYDFLAAYGTPNATIKKLQLGTLNLLKKSNLLEEGTTDILWKKKLYFKVVENQDLHHFIDEVRTDENINKQQPRFILATDFKTILAYDTKTNDSLDCDFVSLNKHFSFFLPLAGMEKAQHQVESIADVKAAEKMAKLYDEIRKDNHVDTTEEVHSLNVFLSRILFCFFAEDTDIFSQSQFTHSISNHTQTDGSDLNEYLERLFDVMNTSNSSRSKLAVYLDAFPYVNGGLFKDKHKAPTFTRRSRQLLLDCGELNWSAINPDIFGSMIQAVITPEHRGGLGMHYTSVPNIMKVIEPLFLNELVEQFQDAKGNLKKLNELLKRIWNIKIFDPACGSGNFLIISYKELRKLEMEIFKEIDKVNGTATMQFSGIILDHFYGIELDDFAHEVAILALWLAEHQMNVEFTKQFGRAKPSLPLNQTGNIVHGNATRLDWGNVCPKVEGDEIYILGNPPYLGSSIQKLEQKEDMALVFKGFKIYKNLDYISAWFFKGANYIQHYNAQLAFVSTNSICQGEQVALIWPHLLEMNLEIGFAHQSFKWKNNAKDNAGVSVVIINVRNTDSKKAKYIFSKSQKRIVFNVSPYLSDGKNTIVNKRSNILSNLPEMVSGNKPVYGDPLILSENEMKEILMKFPASNSFIKKYIGNREFVDSINRYVLWIRNNEVEDASKVPEINKRIIEVSSLRSGSSDVGAQKLAEKSHQFRDTRETNTVSILIPQTGSEIRKYIPIGFAEADTIISNAFRVLYDCDIWAFGLLSSLMHITWVRTVAGRLKTDMQYSNTLCYNTFPFPSISNTQKQDLEHCVFRILEEREKHSEKTIAQLYDPDKMPAGLREAHHQNDLAVERCYRLKPFESDEERLEYLFKLYEQMIVKEKEKGTLFEAKKKSKKK